MQETTNRKIYQLINLRIYSMPSPMSDQKVGKCKLVLKALYIIRSLELTRTEMVYMLATSLIHGVIRYSSVQCRTLFYCT